MTEFLVTKKHMFTKQHTNIKRVFKQPKCFETPTYILSLCYAQLISFILKKAFLSRNHINLKTCVSQADSLPIKPRKNYKVNYCSFNNPLGEKLNEMYTR